MVGDADRMTVQSKDSFRIYHLFCRPRDRSVNSKLIPVLCLKPNHHHSSTVEEATPRSFSVAWGHKFDSLCRIPFPPGSPVSSPHQPRKLSLPASAGTGLSHSLTPENVQRPVVIIPSHPFCCALDAYGLPELSGHLHRLAWVRGGYLPCLPA